jgi:hypothetical protein
MKDELMPPTRTFPTSGYFSDNEISAWLSTSSSSRRSQRLVEAGLAKSRDPRLAAWAPIEHPDPYRRLVEPALAQSRASRHLPAAAGESDRYRKQAKPPDPQPSRLHEALRQLEKEVRGGKYSRAGKGGTDRDHEPGSTE